MDPSPSQSSPSGGRADPRRFYRSPRDGEVTGPFSRAEIDAAVTRGEVHAGTLLCVEETTDWRPASVILFGMREGDASGESAAGTELGAVSPIARRVGVGWPIVATTLSFCLCCLPIGLASLVYAFIANARYEAGDLAGGEKSERLARKWLIATWILLAASCAINVWSTFAMLDWANDLMRQLSGIR